MCPGAGLYLAGPSSASALEPAWGCQPCLLGSILEAGMGRECCGKAHRLLRIPWTKLGVFRQVFCISNFSL